MAIDDGKPAKDAKADDAQFRAVVKRLLDTPPMHKTAAKRSADPKKREPRK
jgi:hypothetical protein